MADGNAHPRAPYLRLVSDAPPEFDVRNGKVVWRRPEGPVELDREVIALLIEAFSRAGCVRALNALYDAELAASEVPPEPPAAA